MYNEIQLNSAIQDLFYVDERTGYYLSAFRQANTTDVFGTTFIFTNTTPDPNLICNICLGSANYSSRFTRHQFIINRNFTFGALTSRTNTGSDFRLRPWYITARTAPMGSAVWANAWMDPVNSAQRGIAMSMGSPVVINDVFRGGFGANMRTFRVKPAAQKVQSDRQRIYLRDGNKRHYDWILLGRASRSHVCQWLSTYEKSRRLC
ncbi:hypothetical protein BC829DRAFT_211292 [Chytridium lagenaria]|nr:hypothetical protein BC829DRAFT_211292 [Chytridium lagenaria]